ncbi:unnamed protein product, partial [Effrenium voratum]
MWKSTRRAARSPPARQEEGSVPRRIFKLPGAPDRFDRRSGIRLTGMALVRFEKSESYVLGTIISAVMVTTII